MRATNHFMSLLVIILFVIENFMFTNQARTLNPKASDHRVVSALYVFGDSYVDPGNNNYVPSLSKSDFSPYGIDYVNQSATGRFSNGKLIADFLASYLGFESYIPYMGPSFGTQKKPAVGFASASTGFDDRTSTLLNVISMSAQLDSFREYKAILESSIATEDIEKHVGSALFYVNAGVSDFFNTYYGPGELLLPDGLNIRDYEQFLLQQVLIFIQGLVDIGARRIVVSGVPAFGCWPAAITTHSKTIKNAYKNRKCIKSYNSVAKHYNQMVQEELKTMQSRLESLGAKIAYFDLYNPFLDMVQNPTKYGFNVVNRGCCGSGLLETSFLCNPLSKVCPDRSKYVFWDSMHPTEAASYIIVKANLLAIYSIIPDELL